MNALAALAVAVQACQGLCWTSIFCATRHMPHAHITVHACKEAVGN